MRTLSTNTLATHPAFPKIVEAYNSRLKERGKVNAKKFYEEVILAEIPTYSLQSWYYFLKRVSTTDGIGEVSVHSPATVNVEPASADAALTDLRTTLLTNSEATQRAIQAALNISSDALQQILENPELLSMKERAELFVKIMKAQDSRVKAIGGMRADNREQERFDRMMDSAAYSM